MNNLLDQQWKRSMQKEGLAFHAGWQSTTKLSMFEWWNSVKVQSIKPFLWSSKNDPTLSYSITHSWAGSKMLHRGPYRILGDPTAYLRGKLPKLQIFFRKLTSNSASFCINFPHFWPHVAQNLAIFVNRVHHDAWQSGTIGYFDYTSMTTVLTWLHLAY